VDARPPRNGMLFGRGRSSNPRDPGNTIDKTNPFPRSVPSGGHRSSKAPCRSQEPPQCPHRGLKRSSPVLIADHGRTVARLEPVTRLGEGEQDGRLSRIVRPGPLLAVRRSAAASLARRLGRGRAPCRAMGEAGELLDWKPSPHSAMVPPSG
jgi:hypothetical protein